MKIFKEFIRKPGDDLEVYFITCEIIFVLISLLDFRVWRCQMRVEVSISSDHDGIETPFNLVSVRDGSLKGIQKKTSLIEWTKSTKELQLLESSSEGVFVFSLGHLEIRNLELFELFPLLRNCSLTIPYSTR